MKIKNEQTKGHRYLLESGREPEIISSPANSILYQLTTQIDHNFINHKEQPFSLTPDPEFLFFSDTHRSAIENILYGISRRMGLFLLIGEVGTGKTTVCRHILNTLKNNAETVYLINPYMTGKELISSILDDLGINHSRNISKKDMLRLLNHFVISLPDSKPMLIIIDDSQAMPAGTMEDLCLLTNLETNKSKLFQILLAGQPELIDQINCHEMRQLEQRIAVTCYLKNLNLQEVGRFISRRLHVAGCIGQIQFTPKTIKKIYEASSGIPRLINRICYYSVASGYITNEYIIRPEHVKKALKELRYLHFKTGNSLTHKSSEPPKKNSKRNFLLLAATLTVFVLTLNYPNLFATFNINRNPDIVAGEHVYHVPENNNASLYSGAKNIITSTDKNQTIAGDYSLTASEKGH